MACDPRYTTLALTSKLLFLGISGRFRVLQSMVFGSREDFDTRDPRYMTLALPSKLVFSGISGRFCGL